MFQIHQQSLKNGLRVIICENHKVPVVNVTVAYKVGSRDESPEHTGLAHLFEHLMFDNIPNPSEKKFDAYLTEAGGESNAYTTYDYTLYHLSVPSSHTELALWLEAKRMYDFIAPESALNTQISVVSEEILQTVKNRPYGTWRELQASLAFSPECSYSWEVHGSREHVERTTYQDALNWFKGFYKPDNSCLVLCGDIQPETGFILAERYFSEIQNTTSTRITSHKSEQHKTGHLRSTQQVPHNAVFISYHCGGFLDDFSLCGDLLSSVLSEGRSSRLYDSIIYKKQIASDVGCYADRRLDSSLLTLFAFANTTEVTCEQLTEAINDELQRLIRDGIKESELTKAKNKLRTGIAYELQTTAGYADVVAQQTLFWKDPERVHSLMSRYEAFTTDDVIRFAQETINEAKKVEVDILAA